MMTDETATTDSICIQCPDCDTHGDVPEWWLEFTTECKNCGSRFNVQRARERWNDEHERDEQ